MGMIERVLTLMFGGGRNVVRDTAQVFRENADAGAQRAYGMQAAALHQYGQEFWTPRRGAFDRFMDGLNRLPRPALALGTMGLFISAMVARTSASRRIGSIPSFGMGGKLLVFY